MQRLVLSVSALLLGVGLLMLGSGLLTSLVGVRLADAGVDLLASGLVTSGYFLGLVLGALVTDRIIHQVGHIRAFTALASLFSALSLSHAFYEPPLFWWALRVVAGVCMAGLFICAESWLNARSGNETRGKILSVYTMTAGLGTGLGQLFLAAFTVEGFILFALSSVLLSLAVVPVALSRTPGPPILERARLPLSALWHRSPLGVGGCVAAGLVLGAFYGMGPIFGYQIGLGASGIAWFMAATIIGGMVLQWPMGRLSDRSDRCLFILAVASGLALLSLSLVAVTAAKFNPQALALLPAGADLLPEPEAVNRHFRAWAGLLVVLFGAAAFTLYPLSVAHANDYTEAEDFVPMSGGLVLSYSLGAMVGPVLASALMEGLGPLGLYVFTALVGGTLGLLCLWYMRTAERIAVTEQEPYRPVPRTSVIAYELDPRRDEAESPSSPNSEAGD